MQTRLDLGKAPAGAYEAMAALDGYVKKSGFDPRLLHLVRMRASQINGCAYCLDMHSKDARAEGETEQRLYALSTPGARRRSTPSGRGPRWRGRRP